MSFLITEKATGGGWKRQEWLDSRKRVREQQKNSCVLYFNNRNQRKGGGEHADRSTAAQQNTLEHLSMTSQQVERFYQVLHSAHFAKSYRYKKPKVFIYRNISGVFCRKAQCSTHQVSVVRLQPLQWSWQSVACFFQWVGWQHCCNGVVGRVLFSLFPKSITIKLCRDFHGL